MFDNQLLIKVSATSFRPDLAEPTGSGGIITLGSTNLPDCSSGTHAFATPDEDLTQAFHDAQSVPTRGRGTVRYVPSQTDESYEMEEAHEEEEEEAEEGYYEEEQVVQGTVL